MSHPARLPLDLFCAQDLSKAKDPRRANVQDLIQAKDPNATIDPRNAKDHKLIQDLNRSAIAQDLGAENTLDLSAKATLVLKMRSKALRQAIVQDLGAKAALDLRASSKDPRNANAQDLIQAKDLNATKDPHNAKDHKPIQDLNRSAITQDLGAESTLDPKISAPAKDPRGESQNIKEAHDE